MNRLILIFTSFLLLSSTTQKVQLNGVWILTYSLTNNKNPHPATVRTLFDFEKDSLSMISVGNFNTGDLGDIRIERVPFKLKNNEPVIAFADGQAKISYSSDSLILQLKGDSKTSLVFKRLKTELQTKDLEENCFRGSYVITAEKYRDSIYFVNDSILLYTGESNINSPAKKWEIVNYKDFHFLNIQDILTPLFVIKSCNTDRAILAYTYQKYFELVLSPIKTPIEKKNLIGKWRELPFNSKPPAPPNLDEKDQYYSLTLDPDSAQIKILGRNHKLKWNITADGKRIYFIDKIFEKKGSWKLLSLNDSIMTVRINSISELEEEEIVRLKKNQTTGDR